MENFTIKTEEYAIVGWMHTCVVNGEPREPDCKFIYDLGSKSGLGWRFDHALQDGYAALSEGAREYVETVIVPQMSEWVLGQLRGEIQSKSFF